ncbi:MAG: energy transducer TonB [Thalassovita sp.]
MMRALEIGVFAGIAVGVHIAFFAAAPDGGAKAGGVGGDTLLSIQAAPQTVIKMVQDWDRPVEVQDVVDAPETPLDQRVTASLAPVSPIARAPRADLKIADLSAPKSDPVQLDMSPATPTPPKPKPAVKPKPQKVAKTKPPTSGRASQKASGSGGTTQAGNSSKSSVATVSKGDQAKLKQIWGAKIRSKVARAKRYPRNSRATGTSVVRLTVRRDGALLGVKLIRSSGDAVLDQAAIASVKRAKRFAKAPKQLPGSTFNFVLPIEKRR